MMGHIPALSDKQMTALGRVLGTNQKFNLTTSQSAKTKRRPTYESSIIPEEKMYTGMYKLVLGGDAESGYTLSVIDGAEETSESCGVVVIAGVFTSPVLTAKKLPTAIASNKYVYVQYDFLNGSSSIVLSESLLTNGIRYLYKLIGRVLFTDGVPVVIQEHMGGEAVVHAGYYRGDFCVGIDGDNLVVTSGQILVGMTTVSVPAYSGAVENVSLYACLSWTEGSGYTAEISTSASGQWNILIGKCRIGVCTQCFFGGTPEVTGRWT